MIKWIERRRRARLGSSWVYDCMSCGRGFEDFNLYDPRAFCDECERSNRND